MAEKSTTKEVLMTSDQYVVQELLTTKKELASVENELKQVKVENETLTTHTNQVVKLGKAIAQLVEFREKDTSCYTSVYINGSYCGLYDPTSSDLSDKEKAFVQLKELIDLVKAIPEREE